MWESTKWDQFQVEAFRTFYSSLDSEEDLIIRFVKAIFYSRDDAIPKEKRQMAVRIFRDAKVKFRAEKISDHNRRERTWEATYDEGKLRTYLGGIKKEMWE